MIVCVCGELTADPSGLCDFCLDEIAAADELFFGPDPDDDPEIVSVRPGKKQRKVTTLHLPGDDRQ